jgi:excinuclease ABC subunit C
MKTYAKKDNEKISGSPSGERLIRSLEILPVKTGVYLFKDERGKIIYVGKARNIYSRVKSYFSARNRDFLYMKPPDFSRQIRSVDYIVTSNEVEALILEGNLIKENRPKYNIELKDDKSYPFIAITDEKYPRVFLTRNRKIKKAKYYGPYTDVGAAKKTIEHLRSIFKIRDCRGVKPGKSPNPPCLNYHIGLCSGPCIGNISESEYKKNVEDIRNFLKGKNRSIVNELKKRMEECSGKLKFEEAEELRKKINGIEKIVEEQKIVFDSAYALDFIAVKKERRIASISLFMYRSGTLALVNNFILENRGLLKDNQPIPLFINQYYENINSIPSKIYTSVSIKDSNLIEEWFRVKKSRKVIVKKPVKGEKKKIMDMAVRNAELYLEKKKFEKSTGHSQGYRDLIRLKDRLGLHNIPRRIECYDISNLGESFPVGSMTVACDGEIDPRHYRHFKIRSMSGQDDCAMLEEIVGRRLRYLGVPGTGIIESFDQNPDLLVIDGGKAQYSSVKKVIDRNGLGNIDIISIAKKEEMIFCERFRNGVKLDPGSELMRIIIRLRDEAHRFAIGYHRKLRNRYMTNSVLDQIKGIGSKKKGYIMENVESVEELKEKSIEDLMNIKGINYRDAVNIYDSFHR